MPALRCSVQRTNRWGMQYWRRGRGAIASTILRYAACRRVGLCRVMASHKGSGKAMRKAFGKASAKALWKAFEKASGEIARVQFRCVGSLPNRCRPMLPALDADWQAAAVKQQQAGGPIAQIARDRKTGRQTIMRLRAGL